MTGKHAFEKAWPSVPADRDLPPGHLDLHREILMSHILSQRPPASARPPTRGTGRRPPSPRRYSATQRPMSRARR
jgi:hypothetical protein